MKTMLKLSNRLLEKGLIPDPFIRLGIRGLLRQKLDEESAFEKKFGNQRKVQLVEFLKHSPIAVNTKEANEQHYEVPPEFFRLVMGKHMKYSCGLWREGVVDFDTSEKDMLELTAERAQIGPDQKILELGCGWGSLTLYMAEKFPTSQIVGVSNSNNQRKFIEAQARARHLRNVKIITGKDHFKLETHWQVNGMHYQKTSEAWLSNMDKHRDEIMPILKQTYNGEHKKWWNYWRIFFMACAELWGYKNGNEWIVSHYRFVKQG